MDGYNGAYTFTYDDSGLLRSKESYDSVTEYSYDGTNLIAEVTPYSTTIYLYDESVPCGQDLCMRAPNLRILDPVPLMVTHGCLSFLSINRSSIFLKKLTYRIKRGGAYK